MAKTDKGFRDFFNKNGLQILLQFVGFLVVIANMWIVSKLAPVTQSLETLSKRVEAIEVRNTRLDPLAERFVVTESRTGEILRRLDRLESKVDVLLDR